MMVVATAHLRSAPPKKGAVTISAGEATNHVGILTRLVELPTSSQGDAEERPVCIGRVEHPTTCEANGASGNPRKGIGWSQTRVYGLEEDEDEEDEVDKDRGGGGVD